MTIPTNDYVVYGAPADIENAGVPIHCDEGLGAMLVLFFRLVRENDFLFTKEMKLVRLVKVNGSNVTRVIARASSRTEVDFLLPGESWHK